MHKPRLFSMLAVMAIFSLASCGGASSAAVTSQGGIVSSGAGATSQGGEAEVNAQIKAVYELYRQDAMNKGETPKSYEEWLASIQGERGVSIVSIEKGSSDGANDTYIIHFSDGSSTTFTLRNGRDAYSCTVLPSEHGYVSVSVGSAFVGEDITFIAHPDGDYSLTHLYLNEVDVIGQMQDPLRYTTKMVKNGFVVRGVFEIDRRVSDQVFAREITNRSFLKEKTGFSMTYKVKVEGYSDAGSTMDIKKSGNIISASTISDNGYGSEYLLIGDNEREDCNSFTLYTRSVSSYGTDPWMLRYSQLTAENVWGQLIPGFYEFSQLDYTYNVNTGYYETEASSLASLGMGNVTNFVAKLGFSNDRLDSFYASFYPNSYKVEIEGQVYAYDGKTEIDPEFVQSVLDEVNRMSIRVAVGASEVDLTRAMLSRFQQENPQYSFEFSVIGMDSGLVSIETGNADIFWFAQDQLSVLKNEGLLSPLSSSMKQKVSASNLEVSVDGVTSDGVMYGYPMTADNGYFMYYDKSVVEASHANSLTAIINDCKQTATRISFDTRSAWYNASFFIGAGCHSIWNVDEEGDFVSCDDNYYSPSGIVAMQGMSELVNSGVCTNGYYPVTGETSVLISGTWSYQEALSAWGSNLACAPLPYFSVNGQSYHMGCFQGSKYLGVKPQSDTQKVEICHQIADYLTSYEAQCERLERLNYGPSNIEASKSSAVENNAPLKALYEQMKYSLIQGQYPGMWWNIAGTLGNVIESGRKGEYPDYYSIKSYLESYDQAIQEIAPNLSPEPTFPSEVDPEDPGPAPQTLTGYGLMIGSTGVMATELAEPDYAGRTQYLIRNQSFTRGDTFTLYNFDNEQSWTIEIDSYSFGAEGSASQVAKYVKIQNGCYVAMQDFTADIYIKILSGDDQIYFQLV